MFCTKCGSNVNEEVKFCGKCGNATTSGSPVVEVSQSSDVDSKKRLDGEIKCGNCEYVGPGEKARSIVAVTLAWLVVVFAPLITILYFLATSKYRCPKCKSTFIGVKNKEGVYTQRSKGSRAVIVFICVLLGIAVIGILASIVLVSLSSAREKAQEASFKAQISGLVPTLLLVCDERNITPKDFASPDDISYFNAADAFKTLRQNCGKNGTSNISFSVTGINEYTKYSADCSSEDACEFHSTAADSELGMESESNTTNFEDTLHTDLIELSDEINTALPKPIDEITMASKTEVSGHKLTYRLEVHTQDVITQATLDEVIKKDAIDEICDDADLRSYVDRGAVFAYSYYYKSGGHIGEIPVSSSDCLK